MQKSSAHLNISEFNVNFVSNIRKLFSRNITQLINTHLPQCRSTNDANKCRKFEKNPPKLTQLK